MTKIKLDTIRFQKLLGYWRKKGFEIRKIALGRIYLKKIAPSFEEMTADARVWGKI